MRKFIAAASVAVFVSGCASQPEDIGTAYVSPIQYSKYDCEQLSLEAGRVTSRTHELYGSLKKTADDDAAQMGVGLILFWPTLFFLEGGDDARATEYARLKGERDAIEKESVQKKCSIEFAPLVPLKPTEEENKTS